MDLYIGYYGTAKGGRTGHNPYACLPGGGASIVDTGVVHVEQSTTNKKVLLNYVLARKDGKNSIMLHWYQTAGNIIVSSGWKQNVERFKGRILHNKNDGAYVQITTSSSDSDIEANKQKTITFSKNLLDVLQQNWPYEK